MPDDFPQFDTDDDMREWFETANLADYALDEALHIAIATHVHLSIGDEPASTGSTTGGASGTVRRVKLVSA